MNPATLAALRGSIKKWQSVVAGDGVDRGRANCDLCHAFLDNHPACVGCPVAESKRSPYCDGTPHEAWNDHHTDSHDGVYHYRDPEDGIVRYGLRVVPGCSECLALAKGRAGLPRLAPARGGGAVTALFVYLVYVGGVVKMYEVGRADDEGRFKSFAIALMWPFGFGAAIVAWVAKTMEEEP